MAELNGFLNILKPPGMSSGAVVAYIKRIAGCRVGHAGTLDPEAAGVLPVMVGRATRLLDHLDDAKKCYIGEIAFAGATTTQDAQGVITKPPAGVPDEETLLKILLSFEGKQMQTPPGFSAIKRNGVPLYKQARKGIEVEVEKREVTIHDIKLLGRSSADSYIMKVNCSRGTYIRTLCNDIGETLGMPAHMRFLLRTSSAGFDISNSSTLEEISDIDSLTAHLIAPDAPLMHLTECIIPESQAVQAINGVALPANEVTEGETVRMYLRGRFLGIAQCNEGKYHFKVINIDHNDW